MDHYPLVCQHVQHVVDLFFGRETESAVAKRMLRKKPAIARCVRECGKVNDVLNQRSRVG